MKNILALSTAIMALAVANTITAAPVNSSFETGDFTGWTVSIPNGTSQYPPTTRPAGSADVVSSWSGTGLTSPISPVAGSYFAAVGTSGNAYFTDYTQTYDISVSQSFSLNAGDTLLGYASFYNGDYEPQDTAWVNVLDSVGVQLSTLWQAASGGLGGSPSTDYRSATPWTVWQWTAPETGTYTLNMGVTTFGDDTHASYGFFDDINVLHPTVVPEPSTTLLLAGGLMSLLGIGSWRKAKK